MKTKLLALDKKAKKFCVQIMERRSINCKSSGRGPIPCLLMGFNYIPESLKNKKDKELK